MPVPDADLVGKVVASKYGVERIVGQGAMGSVWAARHLSLGHPVAIKFIHPDLTRSPTALRRFETEAKAAAKLKSRHVVQVYDHGIADAQPYIVMEYLDGRSLESAIGELGALPPEDVIALIGEAAVALEVAHAAGVVHRDLKPDNIMLANDAESKRGYTVKLVDFGIAKLLSDRGALNVVAQLDSGSVVARFIFASKPNVPDYFTNSSGSFRIVSDHLGEPSACREHVEWCRGPDRVR
jgi:eukaryotic-like serine/threonine-protein kinase